MGQSIETPKFQYVEKIKVKIARVAQQKHAYKVTFEGKLTQISQAAQTAQVEEVERNGHGS